MLYDVMHIRGELYVQKINQCLLHPKKNQFWHSSPVSFALIGLTQLANYWLMLQLLNMTPAEVLPLFKNSTGHSQGIVASVGMWRWGVFVLGYADTFV